MPQRVSDAEVRVIFPTTLPTLQPFIETASVYVDTHLAGTGTAEPVLKEIERYLSAHFACFADPRALSVADGDTSVTLQRGQAGQGLHATQYGQAALALDGTGTLLALGTKKRMVIKLY
jgi:ornithine cyclodeaminase/alanine dehydrogenase-like protein (mu-crystallin family)